MLAVRANEHDGEHGVGGDEVAGVVATEPDLNRERLFRERLIGAVTIMNYGCLQLHVGR